MFQSDPRTLQIQRFKFLHILSWYAHFSFLFFIHLRILKSLTEHHPIVFFPCSSRRIMPPTNRSSSRKRQSNSRYNDYEVTKKPRSSKASSFSCSGCLLSFSRGSKLTEHCLQARKVHMIRFNCINNEDISYNCFKELVQCPCIRTWVQLSGTTRD